MRPTKVLFITAFHPGGKGIIGAGEAISADSIRTLCASGKEVHVLCLAPGTQSANAEVAGLCKSYIALPHSLKQAVLAMMKGLLQGALTAPWLFTRVSAQNIQAAREIISRHAIDEVLLDFPSTLGFAPHLRDLPVDYFVHDVVAQKIGRRNMLGFLGPSVRKTEQRLLHSVRRCLVLSKKDEQLLREMGFRGETEIRPVSQVRVGEVANGRPVAEILAAFAGTKNLVFFGNMRRPENHWSILHFILFEYPKIRRCQPDARFWVIGLAPRVTLRLLGRVMRGVRIAGAVDDPGPAFRAADLCVVPLRLGAGVKIKVLQMLDAGARVISSPVGGEGIAASPNLIVVPYGEIADAVCRILSNPAQDVSRDQPAA